MSKTIISLCGRKRTGKESAYKTILQYVDHPEEFQFATPLKKFCIEVLGLTHDQCYGSDQDRESLTKYAWKDVDEAIRIKYGKDPNSMMTARDVLQVVGTDLMRKGLYMNVWAEGGIREATRSSAKTCIFTDTRFPNEVKVTRLAPTLDNTFDRPLLIRLYRDTGLNDGHESETALDCWDLVPNQRRVGPEYTDQLSKAGYSRINDTLWRGSENTPYDFLVDNNSTLASLRKNMLYILKEWEIYREPSCS